MAPAYDLDDLDDEWKALLSELEDRLYQVLLTSHLTSIMTIFDQKQLLDPISSETISLSAWFLMSCVAQQGISRTIVPCN